MDARTAALIAKLSESFAIGSICIGRQQYGWVNKGTPDNTVPVRLLAVDHSLQDIGGPDDVVLVSPLDFSWTITVPAGVLPPMVELPRCQAVINARRIHNVA